MHEVEVRAWLELLHFGVSAAMQDMLSRPSASGTSVGAHHAGETIALMSYNIGFNNEEVLSGTHNFELKKLKLEADIASAFTNEIGIQALLLCEFGNMFDTLDRHLEAQFGVTVVGYFENIVRDIPNRLPTMDSIRVVAKAPYVALVDSDYWQITCHHVRSMCDEKNIRA
jgi:hypothetical protein